MPLMDESPCHGTGTGVQIFIRAPSGKVDIPIMQVQFDIARGVSEIKPDDCSCPVSRIGYRPHIEGLTRVIVHTAEQNERDLVTVSVDGFDDVFSSQRRFTIA